MPPASEPMKPAFAKMPEPNALEDLGRATLQIVHDLKNQLNGLKLYATFLRKRLERDDRAVEERETLAKLIAGLDRSARDMTALVNYGRPLELHCQAESDLREILLTAARESANRSSAPLVAPVPCDIEAGRLHGNFDSRALSEALAALTSEGFGNLVGSGDTNPSINVKRIGTNALPQALIEWRGMKSRGRSGNQSAQITENIHIAFATRIIAAHGGRIDFDKDSIRVCLPISN